MYSQDNGLSELLLVYEEKNGLRQFLAAMVLLGYHLFITTFMCNREVDTRLCEQILEEKVAKYPKGVFFLFFKGRFHLIQVCTNMNQTIRGHLELKQYSQEQMKSHQINTHLCSQNRVKLMKQLNGTSRHASPNGLSFTIFATGN